MTGDFFVPMEPAPMDIDLPRPFIPPDSEWVPVTVQDPKTVVIGGRTYFNVHFDAADIENDSENTEESDSTNEDDVEQPDRKSDTDDFSDEESSEDEYACSDHPTHPYFFTAEDLEEEKKNKSTEKKRTSSQKISLELLTYPNVRNRIVCGASAHSHFSRKTYSSRDRNTEES